MDRKDQLHKQGQEKDRMRGGGGTNTEENLIPRKSYIYQHRTKPYLPTNGKFGAIRAECKTPLWSDRFKSQGIPWNNADSKLLKNEFE
jgi:hypothetical protein